MFQILWVALLCMGGIPIKTLREFLDRIVGNSGSLRDCAHVSVVTMGALTIYFFQYKPNKTGKVTNFILFFSVSLLVAAALLGLPFSFVSSSGAFNVVVLCSSLMNSVRFELILPHIPSFRLPEVCILAVPP